MSIRNEDLRRIEEMNRLKTLESRSGYFIGREIRPNHNFSPYFPNKEAADSMLPKIQRYVETYSKCDVNTLKLMKKNIIEKLDGLDSNIEAFKELASKFLVMQDQIQQKELNQQMSFEREF